MQFKKNPTCTFIALIVAVLPISAVILRVVERTSPDSNLINFTNSLWLLTQTQFTIGYGDIIPKTLLGRTCIVMFCLFGTFMTSFSVMLTSSMTSMTSSEIQFMRFYISKKTLSAKLKLPAVVCIQRWWRVILKKRRREIPLSEHFNFRTSFMKFVLKQKKLRGEKLETLTELLDFFETTKSKELRKTFIHVVHLKRIRNAQSKIRRLHEQSCFKLDSFEFMLQKYVKKVQAFPKTKPQILLRTLAPAPLADRSHYPLMSENRDLPSVILADKPSERPPNLKSSNLINISCIDKIFDDISDTRPSFPTSPTEHWAKSTGPSYRVYPYSQKLLNLKGNSAKTPVAYI